MDQIGNCIMIMGGDQNYLVEYSEGSSEFNFKPGKGFWIICINALEVDRVVNSVPLSSENIYSIDLHTGWNIITNPYERIVLWDRVKTENNISENIWEYDGSFSSSSTFQPYEGYYFL